MGVPYMGVGWPAMINEKYQKKTQFSEAWR